MIKIWFFGTPEVSLDILEHLRDNEAVTIAFVVTWIDQPVGRWKKIQSTPVKARAMKYNIPVFTPERIRDNKSFQKDIAQFECDYFVVVAYGKILPKEILDLPKKKCLNIHASLLPLYRGASPVQSALAFWDKLTGITIMEMNTEMDAWDMLAQESFLIGKRDTAGILFKKIGNMWADILIDTIKKYEKGEITPIPQQHHRATYCTKISKKDGCVDWSKRAEDIYYRWQAYTPWPGLYTFYNGKRLIFESVGKSKELYHPDRAWEVVRLSDGNIGIICGEATLIVFSVTYEGKKAQDIDDFINGHQDFISSRL
jgi:methionyl-tRNA formyltransferase